MLRLLNRLLLVLLCAALLIAVYGTHTGMTMSFNGHDTYYFQKRPWLHSVHEVALYGILGWCVLFAHREVGFVRLGLMAIILSFAITALPPKAVKLPGIPAAWH